MASSVSEWLAQGKPTEWITAIVAMIGVAGALVSYKSRTAELSSKATLDRFENYRILNELIEKDPHRFAVISALANPGFWPKVTDTDRFCFLSLYEQAALMLQSGLISEDVAFYTYAFDLMRVYNDDNFWNKNVTKDNKYWALTKVLADRFVAYEKRYHNKQFPVQKFRF